MDLFNCGEPKMCRNPQSSDVRAIEIKSMKEVNEKLAEIMQLLVNTTGKLDASKQLNMGTVKPKSNALSNQSGLEQLINHALKYSTSECLLIHRFIESKHFFLNLINVSLNISIELELFYF